MCFCKCLSCLEFSSFVARLCTGVPFYSPQSRSKASSSPSSPPSSLTLHSTRSDCSFAREDCVSSPSSMTHRATARSPFPIDRFSWYLSVPAASNNFHRLRARSGQKLRTCFGSSLRQPRRQAGETTPGTLRACNNAANPIFFSAELNRE